MVEQLQDRIKTLEAQMKDVKDMTSVFKEFTNVTATTASLKGNYNPHSPSIASLPSHRPGLFYHGGSLQLVKN